MAASTRHTWLGNLDRVPGVGGGAERALGVVQGLDAGEERLADGVEVVEGGGQGHHGEWGAGWASSSTTPAGGTSGGAAVSESTRAPEPSVARSIRRRPSPSTS